MKNEIELAPYIEDLTWALGNSVDSTEIEAELKKYLDNFDVPIGEAKRCVLKKFGGDPQQLGKVVDRTIEELTRPENSVNLLCRIIYIADKEITVEGKAKMITFGILGDPTGTVPFTAWHELSCDKGDVIRVYNAYTRTRNGKGQVNFGNRTHVRVLPSDALPNVKNNGGSQEYSVKDFREGIGNIRIVFRILDIEERKITIKGEEKRVFRGYAADETGKCRFAAWSDFELNVDDVVRVDGGYIKSWRGVPEFQLNGGATVEKLPGDALPARDILAEDKILTISNLKDLGGAASVAVEGIILDVRPGSGLIERCPECNRVLQDTKCMVHGKVKGEFDLRIKGVLDDGTGAITIVIGKENTEKILGLDLNGCLQLAKDQMRTDIIYDQLIKRLLARPVKVTGVVLSDDFGLMMIGGSIEFIVPKIKTESISLLEGLGMNINNEV